MELNTENSTTLLVSATALQAICPTLSPERAAKFSALINTKALKYGIKTRDQIQEPLANIVHESGDFIIKSENMNYTTAHRIWEVWPDRFTNFQRVADLAEQNKVTLHTVAEAKDYYFNTVKGKKRFAEDFTKNPTGLANLTYNGRMGNGVTGNDGYNFRGFGFLQSTGRETATAYNNYCNNSEKATLTVEQRVELCRTDDEAAMDVAFWEYAVALKLINAALGSTNFDYICKRINGGFVGIAERRRIFELCKKYIV